LSLNRVLFKLKAISPFKAYYFLLILPLLFLSCGGKKKPLPYTVDEANKLAREIRINHTKPDDWVMEKLEEGKTVNLVETRGYAGGLEVLKYLVPLLHSKGVFLLDLWFIPEDGLVQANALLTSTLFYENSAADLSGETGYLYLYEEHLDFLRYLYDFNKNLEKGETPMTLATLPLEETRGVIYSYEPIEGGSPLIIQNPPALEKLKEEGEDYLINQMNQLFPLLNEVKPFFVVDQEHFLWKQENQSPLLVLAMPETLTPCHPLEKGINKENYKKALSSFPKQIIKGPAFLGKALMKRAQKKYIKRLN
jgi:hypothetical protein